MGGFRQGDFNQVDIGGWISAVSPLCRGHPILSHSNLVYYLLPKLPSLGQGDQQQKKAKSQLLRLSPLSKKSCVCHNVRKDRRKATAALARAFTTQFFA